MEPINACWLLLDLDAWFSKFDVQSAGKEGPIALELYATFDLWHSRGKRRKLENRSLMKHFYCDLPVQHLNLHKNWHISFLLVAKSDILYISVINTVYCFVLVLTVFQSGYMRINKKCQHHFPCWWLSFELFFDGPCHRFPFHMLAFTLWLTVIHPHTPTGNAYQECLNLMAIVKQKALAECQMVAFVLSYNVFGKALAEPCIIGRCLAISSITTCRLFRIKAQTSWMFSSVQDVNGCPDLSSVVTLVQSFFKDGKPFIHSAKHCSHIVLKLYHWFLPMIHLQLTQILSMHSIWC